MKIRFIEKFNLLTVPSGIKQGSQGIDHPGFVESRLLQKGSGHAQGNPETRMSPDQFSQHSQSREIRSFRSGKENLFVFLIPEEFIPIRMKTEGLV